MLLYPPATPSAMRGVIRGICVANLKSIICNSNLYCEFFCAVGKFLGAKGLQVGWFSVILWANQETNQMYCVRHLVGHC